MKITKRFLLISLFASLALSIFAQKVVSEHTIFDEFQRLSREGKGVVLIHQSSVIRNKVGKALYSETSGEDESSFVEMQGFRIQVFTGNQRSSKEEAEKRQMMIQELFPDAATYLIYKAPFWRLQVGDYFSSDAAQSDLLLLKKEFPDFAKEIYVVKEKIKVQL